MTTGSNPSPSTGASAADLAGGARSSLERRSRNEQIGTLYRLAPGNFFAALAAAVIVCVVLNGRVDPDRLLGWFGAMALLTAGRYYLLFRYGAARSEAAQLGKWASLYVGSSALGGLLWGSAAHVLMPPDSLALQAFVYIVLAGMMAGASLSMTVYLPAYVAFVVPLGLLMLASFARESLLVQEEERLAIGLGVLLAGWMGAMAYFARTANAAYLRALRLDQENRALDQVLDTRIAEIESSNETLAAQIALREATEADLRRAKEQLQLALRASELSIWDWTVERNLVYLDATWSSMLGREPQARYCSIEELIELVHPDDLFTARKAQLACLKGETEEYSVEHRVRATDGRWIWIMSRGRVADRNPNGLATRMIGTNLNITARREAQARIETLNRTLEGKLAELADANRDLQNFSSMVSHDLHAPLRRIAGFAEMLAARTEARLDEESLHFLNRIRANSKRMAALIDDLLQFARTTSKQLDRSLVDLNALVREVCTEMVDPRESGAIAWNIASLPRIDGDHALLKSVFANLIGNAVKFTRTRTDRHIEIGSVDTQDPEHVVYVRDNGVGFDPRYRDRLFAPFQRLHSEREFEGTGIGLATVHRIVERHGGRLWAESDIDQGATFYVSVPANSGTVPAARAQSA
jgi:signal transduction histidine kinase